MQDDGGRHLEKSKNNHILATVSLIAVKFGKVMHMALSFLLTIKSYNF